jgi:hypothetical protein
MDDSGTDTIDSSSVDSINAAGSFGYQGAPTAQQTYTLPDGTTWATDANGNAYQTGYNPALITDGSTPVTIPNLGGPTGPGANVPGTSSATQFSLGNVATGIAQTLGAFTSSIPAAVNAINNAKLAATAVSTPTFAQQWLEMSASTKIVLIGGLGILIYAIHKSH